MLDTHLLELGPQGWSSGPPQFANGLPTLSNGSTAFVQQKGKAFNPQQTIFGIVGKFERTSLGNFPVNSNLCTTLT
jgi:hypothetical protein